MTIGQTVAGIALAILLIVAVPLFVCMPLWADVTLYDLAARNILRGGVHYRDIFDTNLPGIVWVHAAIRFLFGWRSEAIRLFDFAAVTGIVLLLMGWLRRFDVTGSGRTWTAFGLFGFYFGTTEWCHCQRDVWMLLPALVALELRRGQMANLAITGARWNRTILIRGIVEGLCWGAAFWIKPYVAVPALICWLLSSAFVFRVAGRRFDLILMDGLALLCGGLVAGGLGIAWLVSSGAWPYFWDVFLDWNPEYLRTFTRMSVAIRIIYVPCRLLPWGLVLIAAVPVTFAAIGRLFLLPSGPQAQSSLGKGELGLFAGFYLGWVIQAGFLQVPYDYTLTPQVFLGVCLLVGRGWPISRSVPGIVVLAIFAAVVAIRHPLFNSDRLTLWGKCWQEGSSARMRDGLRLEEDVDWQELDRVADYLGSLGLQDEELTCYNNATHPLYLTLDLKPSTRFLHFDTLLRFMPSQRETIRRELADSRQRYVVSDLRAAGLTAEQREAWWGSDDPLPRGLPEAWAERFPWNESVVFKTRQYVVHRVTVPVGILAFKPDKL